MKFQECDCKPLWKTLMLLQFMPASIRQPKCAVHFGFLQAIHDRKVIGQDSVTSWVEWMNLQNSRRAASDSGEEVRLIHGLYLHYLIAYTHVFTVAVTWSRCVEQVLSHLL